MDQKEYSGEQIVFSQAEFSGTGPGGTKGMGSMGGMSGGYEDNFSGFETVFPAASKKPKFHWKKFWAVVLIVVVAAAAGFGGGIAGTYFGQKLLPSGQTNAALTIQTDSNINTAQAVAEKVLPSVVGISTQIAQQSWFGETQGTGIGTGIIVDKSGYILTNSHVVNDGKTKNISVQLSDGSELPGQVLWNDASIDLAIVKIDADNLTAAELGDSEDVSVGAYAVAIGNPLGMAFERSVTQGVISGLNRSITVTQGNEPLTMDGLIQTDASINSGNSGGPLLNSKGQVIGINTAKAQTGEGLGFAIPINTAKPIVEEIRTKGEFKRAYIGVTGVSVADWNEMYPDQRESVDKGARVMQIYTDSPAAKAGMKEGDIITAVNDSEVDTITKLISNLYQHRPGDTVTLQVLRDGKTMKIDVTLEEMAE